MLRAGDDVDAAPAQNFGHEFVPAAVQGSIYNFARVFSAGRGHHRAGLDRAQVGFVQLRPDQLHEAHVHGRRKIAQAHGRDHVAAGGFRNFRGHLLRNLHAVRSVDLVAVVVLRVVAGRDVDAERRAERTHGKGDFGRGAYIVKQIDAHA